MGGGQREGIPFNIPTAASHADHVEQALLQPFRLGDPIPLPDWASASIEFIRDTPGVSTLHHWSSQLKAVRELVRDSRPIQLIWDSAVPPSLQPVAGRIASVALTDLVAQYGLGGGRWVRQFTFGFDVMGGFSKKFLPPVFHKVEPPHGDGLTSHRRGRALCLTRSWLWICSPRRPVVRSHVAGGVLMVNGAPSSG